MALGILILSFYFLVFWGHFLSPSLNGVLKMLFAWLRVGISLFPLYLQFIKLSSILVHYLRAILALFLTIVLSLILVNVIWCQYSWNSTKRYLGKESQSLIATKWKSWSWNSDLPDILSFCICKPWFSYLNEGIDSTFLMEWSWEIKWNKMCRLLSIILT